MHMIELTVLSERPPWPSHRPLVWRLLVKLIKSSAVMYLMRISPRWGRYDVQFNERVISLICGSLYLCRTKEKPLFHKIFDRKCAGWGWRYTHMNSNSLFHEIFCFPIRFAVYRSITYPAIWFSPHLIAAFPSPVFSLVDIPSFSCHLDHPRSVNLLPKRRVFTLLEI